MLVFACSQVSHGALPLTPPRNRLDKAAALLEAMLQQRREGENAVLPQVTESVSGTVPGNIPTKGPETILENNTAETTTAAAATTATRTTATGNKENTIPPTADNQDCSNDHPLWDFRLPLPRPDTISFSTVIDGCAYERDGEQAIRLLERMRFEGIGVKKGFDRKSTSKHGGGGGSKHPTTPEQHGKILGRNSQGHTQRETLEKHIDEKARSKEKAQVQGELVGDSKRGLISRGNHEQGLAENQRIAGGDQHPPSPNAHCVTAAISACGRSGMPDNAVEILLDALACEEAWFFRNDDRESSRNISRDSNSSVNKAEEVGRVGGGKGANGTISRAKKNMVRRAASATSAFGPAINAAMDACVKAGRHDQARAVAREAARRGLTLGIEGYNSLLMMASDWDQVSGAEAFLSCLSFLFIYIAG